MSWFPEQLAGDASKPTANNAAATTDDAQPGVLIERRTVLTLLPVGIAAMLAGDSRAAVATLRDPDGSGDEDLADPLATGSGLTMDQLIDEITPHARDMLEHEWRNEDAYLYHLASLLLRLDESARKAIEKSERKVAFHQVASRALGDGRLPAINILQIRMQPGAGIPWHDHRGYNGVILGLEGSVRLRNYDLVPEDVGSESKEVKIRENSDMNLGRGRVSTLSTRRDNIHDLKAGDDGGCVLDVFTLSEQMAGSKYLEVNEESPVDPDARIFEAQWS